MAVVANVFGSVTTKLSIILPVLDKTFVPHLVFLVQLNDEKTPVILALEAKIEHLTEKMLDLSYEMEKNKRSRPPSSFLVKKSERQIVKEKEKEKEKDEEEHQVKKKVEESAKPAFNFKDDFEKMFNFGNKSKLA